jgi:hypothetical protein
VTTQSSDERLDRDYTPGVHIMGSNRSNCLMRVPSMITALFRISFFKRTVHNIHFAGKLIRKCPDIKKFVEYQY